MSMQKWRRLFALVCALAIAPSIVAQAGESSVNTAQDPKISESELDLMLTPLTAEELSGEAVRWRDLLKQQVSDISAKEIAKARAKEQGQDVTAMQTELNTLGDERSAVIRRMRIVLDELKAKGGDIEEHEKYVAAVDALPEVDPTDVSATWSMIEHWVTSEEGGLLWAKNIFLFLITLFVFKILSSFLGKITDRAVRTMKNTPDLLRSFFVNTVRKTTFLLGLVVAVSMLGVNIAPLVAGIGAVGLVVGFALQGTLSNFASGIMILLYRPYDVGDVVNTAGITGKVNAMSLVSTSLLTPDNQSITVPNSSIWGGIITNITANDTRRVDLVFGIGYSDDIAKAHAVLEDIVGSHELVLKDPEPVIKVHELADSSVNFVVRPWAKTSDYWTVYWDLTRMVKERFDAEDISIPFPQRDVHMHQVAS